MTANQITCSKCGSPVTPGMKFCESCGAKIEAVPTCPKCGAALAPNMKFCESCGAPVKITKEVAVPVAAPVTPVSEPAPVKEAPPPEEPPLKEKPAEIAQVATAAPATVIPEPKEEPVKETKPPAEPPGKAEQKPAPAPEEKPATVPVKVKEPSKTEKVKGEPKEAGPKPSGSSKIIIIAGIIILALLAAVVYFIGLPMLSGSGTPVQNPTVSPATTNSGSSPASSSQIPVTTAVTSQAGAFSLTPGLTQVPPSNLGLIIDVERDAITHMITVTFQGGPGQYGVRELAVTLTRSDGTVETKSFKPENRGSFITLKGTEKTDRVEITANYYNGESYKVVDQIFEYKKRTGSP